MFEESGGRLRNRRFKKTIGLVCFELRALEKRNQFVKHEHVFRRLDILRDSVREPSAIIGDARPNPLARLRQPPMLHVALGELTRRGAEQVFARQIGPGGGESHAVLQLVAKTVGAASLIERRARPDAA